MTETGTLNFLWSQHLVAGFVAAGVRHAVISPGSRSTPLALALLRQPRIACEVVVDERCAAFFGLGIAKATRAPVLLLATSGSAPANWLPAVVEASQSGAPLLLLSADRPAELHGCGANQTIDQLALFGPHVRARHAMDAPHEDFAPARLHALAAQACAQASGPLPGPVHLNQPFREPLTPAVDCPPVDIPPTRRVAQPPGAADSTAVRALAKRIAGRPGCIVCGEMPPSAGFPDALAALAAQLDCPVLAEPLSGLRFGPHDRSRLNVRYVDWLPAAPAGEWLLRFGAFPVTRALQQFTALPRPLHVLVDPWPRWNDPAHRLTDLLHADPAAFCRALLAERPAPAEPAWRAAFAGAVAKAPWPTPSPACGGRLGWGESNNIKHLSDTRPHPNPPPQAGEGVLRQPLAEREAAAANPPNSPVAALIAALPEDTPLFVGNSLAVRELDRASGSADKRLPIFANRGVSGIDGNLSTALGVAAATGRVAALVGDLTCQHDIGGLALAAGKNAVIVVINNGGGGIFEQLPQRALPEFERGWKTPQSIDFGHAAKAFGLSFHRPGTPDALREALTSAFAAGGPHLIEWQCQ